jgi:Alanine racemase, N-terminal domain
MSKSKKDSDTFSTGRQSVISKLWLSIPTTPRWMVVEVVSALMGLILVYCLTKNLELLGAVFGLIVGNLCEFLFELRESLRSYHEKINCDLEKLSQATEKGVRATDDLVEVAMMDEIAKSMVNESPFTGVLGTLFHESGGRPYIEGNAATREKYLSRLGDAVAASERSFYTIQPMGTEPRSNGIKWFNDKEGSEYLRVFREKTNIRVIRVFLMPSKQDIEEERLDANLVGSYLRKVGVNTESYWICKSDMQALEREMKSNKSYANQFGDLYGKVEELDSGDSVVCDGKLFFNFENETNPGHRRINFEHNAQGTIFPFKWVWDNVSSRNVFIKIESPSTGRWGSELGYRDNKELAIDLKKVDENLRLLDKHIGKKNLMAVLKSDAYGLGLDTICPRVVKAGVDWFGVSSIEEALIVRRHSNKASILVMEAMHALDCDALLDEDIQCFLWSLEHAKELNAAGERRGKKAKVHLKINTGMNRLGIRVDDLILQILKLSVSAVTYLVRSN